MTDSTLGARRVQRVRHEIKRRELQVARVARISPHFQRVTFAGEALADFISASFDDHVKLILADGQGEPAMRDYTPRRHDAAARELDIEFALPAVARRLEELPAGTRAIVRLAVADPADRRTLASAASLDLQWLDSDDALLAATRALALPPGEGYAWCAAEAASAAALRRVLVDEKGHDRHAIRAAAYWKRGAAAHHENLDG